ncbi:MAG: hypothetical protein AB1540_17505, partial [Bdellovibrionota bacterium]
KEDVAAIRVLKNYPGKFAGKIILSFKTPELKQEYRALKKLGYKIMEMIKEREKRGKDLDFEKTDEDLAKEVAPDDDELDRGIPTSPKGPAKKQEKPKPEKLDELDQPSTTRQNAPEPLFDREGNELTPESIEVRDEEEPFSDLSVQEDLPLEPLRHALTLQYGAMRNVDKDNNPATYSALGLRYAFNFLRMALFQRKNLQDMFTLELGMFYYTISGFSATDDSVTVLPLVGTFRYNLLVGEAFTFFLYTGILKNNVSVSAGTLSSNVETLSTTNGVFGGGTLIKIGPHWAGRLEFGTDLFGVGAVLKF